MKPGDPNFVIIGGTNLYRSTDGFATAATTDPQITQMHISGYAPLTGFSDYPNGHPDHHAVVFYPNNTSKVLVGDDGGVRSTSNINTAALTQVTVNGTTRDLTVLWTPLNSGYTTTQFYAVAIDPAPTVGSNTANVIIGGLQDNGTLGTYSSDASVNWRETVGGDGTFSGIGAAGTYYLSGNQNGGITRHDLTMSQSGTFAPNPTDIKPDNALAGGSSFMFVSPYTVDPANTNRLYLAAGSRLWRNDNVPTATTSVGWTNLGPAEVAGTRISAIGVSASSDRLYYGTEGGHLYRLDGASASPTRTDVGTGKGFNAGAYVSSIAVHPTNANHAAVVFSNYGVRSVYVTDGRGGHLDGRLRQPRTEPRRHRQWRFGAVDLDAARGRGCPVLCGHEHRAVFDQQPQRHLYHWAKEGTGTIGNTPVNMIAARPSDGLVAIATHGNGMYSSNVTALPVELMAVSATAVGRTARLSWTTASETNNAGFNVEQQTGARWRDVGFVAGRGTTTEQATYAYAVEGLDAGLHRFRLRQVDFDGSTHYSSTVEVNIGLEAALTVAVRGRTVGLRCARDAGDPRRGLRCRRATPGHPVRRGGRRWGDVLPIAAHGPGRRPLLGAHHRAGRCEDCFRGSTIGRGATPQG